MRRTGRALAMVILTGLGGWSLGCGTSSMQQANLAYLSGTDYMNEEQPELAIKKFDQAIEFVSDNADYFVARGMAYYHLGRFGLAVLDLDRALQLNPKLVPAYGYRGSIYLLQKRTEDARRECAQAVTLDPKYAPAYTCMGTAHLEMDQFDESAKAFKRAIELDPKDVFAAWGMERAKGGFGTGKPGGEAGASGWTPAGDLLAKHVETLIVRREYREAIQLLTRVIRLMQADPHVAADLGHLLALRGRVRELDKKTKMACDDYREACVNGYCDVLTQKRDCRP